MAEMQVARFATTPMAPYQQEALILDMQMFLYCMRTLSSRQTGASWKPTCLEDTSSMGMYRANTVIHTPTIFSSRATAVVISARKMVKAGARVRIACVG